MAAASHTPENRPIKKEPTGLTTDELLLGIREQL